MTRAQYGRKPGQKARDTRKHAQQRFSLRFGVTLTVERRAEILRMIRSGKAKFVERQSNAVAIHRVVIDDHEIDVVFNKELGEIVTVLYPPDADDPNGQG